ncbi:thiamine pyrophosphate-binding protein [Sphingomonas soli]|uniref:thiamine pyrophosphate-binding protein n=1 Tax=Sphingomonas soli TaxID=266127 RepID=UPI00082D0371|nr:thiamine pyrophosphate-binding protein [Sphingomonas soli]
MKMTGGEAIARMVQAHGTELAFGMGGFQLLPYYDGVRRLGVRHILINDERTGAFAADAASRVTGAPAVCDATLGPGATNLATALAESFNAGVPMVALTGDAHRDYAHRNMTQETRQNEILAPVAKELLRVEKVERIPEMMRRAYSVATSGRGGPVVVDVPEDVAHGEAEFAEADFEVSAGFGPRLRCRPDRRDIERAAALLARAKRPMILAGGGIHLSEATAALRLFAEARGIPVAHTLSGKGAIACTDPLSVGLFGRYSRIANDLMEQADVLLVVGCKLGEIATKRYALPPASAKVIHLDILPEEIERWRRVDVALWGDARSGLEDLLEALGPAAKDAEYHREIAERTAKWYAEARERLESADSPINVGRVVGELNKGLPEDAIVVADGGFASHWVGLLYDTKQDGRGFVAGRGMASIGYGLPGALGCKLAAPDRPVVGLTGDGGFNMVAGDLETARRAGAGFALIVLNNAASGYIKALQHAVYGEGNYQSSDLGEINYADVARAYGCEGIRIENPDDLAGAVKRISEPRDVPLILDLVVTRDPAQMLPGVDNRTLKVEAGDRPV